MLRLPYRSPCRMICPLTLAAALALPLAWTAAALAQTAAPADQAAPVAAPAPTEATPQDKQLRNDVDAYFHYAWIGRYDLASQFAQKIVDEAADSSALIPVLEQTAKLHDQTMGYMAQILLFDNQADLKEATDKLLLKVQAGNITRSQDPALIEKMIRDMSAGERAYENHLPFLRRSGEIAVPIMIQFLRLEDDQHKPYRGTVRRALVDLGRTAVNPLLAATEMKEEPTLLVVIDTLGSLGYDVGAPYLARLANDSAQSEAVHNAANSALGRLQIAPAAASDPAKLFYDLALRFYYGKTDIGQTIDNPGATAAAPVQTRNYWLWDGDKGLGRTEVPAAIFNDLMAMRTCEQALTIRAGMADVVSLWLDADNKREADLPDGAADPVRGSQPPAHYFNVSSGSRHLNDALSRSLRDRDAAVSLKLTHSLGLIVGRGSMNGREGGAITDALRFPDKRVRFEAALGIAAALPSKPVANQDLVVPLLVQAIGEGGGGNVLALAPDRDDANALAQTLRSLGYVAAAAGSTGEAVSAAASLPSVDAIVIARGMSDTDVTRMMSLARQTPRLADAVEVVLKDTATGPIAALALDHPQISITTQTDGDALKKDIDAARNKAGLGALDPREADSYAQRSANALERLAVSQNAILTLAPGEQGLLAAIDGGHAELVSAVGNVLARIASPAAQQGLARRALDDQTPQPIRLSLFQSLTISAKAFGNQLSGSQVSLLEKESVDLKDNDIRSAAAEARGALNLPTDRATSLILSQNGN